MRHAQDFDQEQDSLDMSSIEIDESQEPLRNSIYEILCKILCKCYGEENDHATTLSVLGLLKSYRWDAKLILALSAFAMVYGDFWVIMQSQNQNALAASIALLKQFPTNYNAFKPIFVALTTLVKTTVELIRCVVRYESLPITYDELQDDTVTQTKSTIYVAAYWVVRSIMVCISLVTDLRGVQDEQDPYSISDTVWQISSLKSRISKIGTKLKTEVDDCQQQIEQKMHEKLKNVFQGIHYDNQEVLHLLFSLKDDLPLKQSSNQEEIDVSSLKNKVVILLISKPELLPIEDLLLLVQQTYDHPLHNKLNGSYDIVWVPVSPSDKWSNNEVRTFTFLSNSLPWYSVRQPWSLRSTAIKYAKEEWQFGEYPIMVVIDTSGRVTHLNAVDMVWIWGAQAYPFSTAREEELWKEEKWSMRLLLDNIDPLLTMWVDEGRTICIYGSNKLDWIREFSAKIKDIGCLVSQLELVYVGTEDRSELTSNIVSVIEREKLSKSLSVINICFFWCRLKSIRRSKLRLGQTIESDHILREVEALLVNSEYDNDKDWVIIGRGSSTNMVKIKGNEWVKFLGEDSFWRKYLPKIGLVDCIRMSLEIPASEPCAHSRIVRCNEGLMEESAICEKCKHPMEKFIIYDAVK